MDSQLLQGFYDTRPLWTREQFGIAQFVMPDQNNGFDLIAKVPSNLRLGHQMEVVFKNLIQSSKTYKVLLSNILIEAKKKRLGELDFIIQEITTQKIIHVELAYKFYIIEPAISEPIYRLMGPNKRDMFHIKLNKLKTHQFPLLYHPSLHKYWDALHLNPNDIAQEVCFKTQLFQPYGHETVHIRPLNMQCIYGKWIRFDAFNDSEFSRWQFYMPSKREWVIAPRNNVSWMNHFNTLLEVNIRMVKENAPMLWCLQPDGSISKLFVVWW